MTQYVIKNMPNCPKGIEISKELSAGLPLARRGRGARHRDQHQSLPLSEASRFSLYIGRTDDKAYFNYVGMDPTTNKPRVRPCES